MAAALEVICLPKEIKKKATQDTRTSPANPHIGAQMKRTAAKAKDAAAGQLEEPQGSPQDYAGDTIEDKAKSTTQDAVQTADIQGRKAVKQVQQRIRQKKKTAPHTDTTPIDELLSKLHDGDQPADAVVPDKAKEQKRRAQDKKKKAAQQRGRSRAGADKPAKTKPDREGSRPNQPKHKVKNTKPKQKPGRTIGRAKKSTRAVQQSMQCTQQGIKATAKSAKTTKQAAHRTKQIAQQSAKTAKTAVKSTWKALKATVKGAKLLAEAIIAGGWVAVVIILVICLAAFLIASPFGIFFSSGDGEQSLPQVVQTLSREYYDRFDLVQHNYVHDILSFDGNMAINWEQVLAVYAVKVTGDPLEPDAVTSFDDKKVNQLRKILNEMNSFTYSVQNAQTDNGIKRTLTIHVAQKSASAMAQTYRFNNEQKTQLNELLSGDYADMWAQLLGGYVPGSGEVLSGDAAWIGTDIFAWPMQPGYRISSRYGYRDNPTNPGETKFHSGVDLAAPEGTPILAAADGVVTVANATDSWGMGWGLHIKLKHASGYETLYAHCSRIAVAVGEEVKKGQVIGYVGSTGNSTGNHLHFTVYKNGVVTDPLGCFEAV